MRVDFEIPGPPVAKGRPRFSTAGGAVRTYTPEKTAEYENLVKLSYLQKTSSKLEGAIDAKITAYFAIPKSTSKKKRQMMIGGEIRPAKKPDLDNIAKSVLDALNGIAFDDDSQVCSLTIDKWYGENPQVKAELKEIEEIDE